MSNKIVGIYKSTGSRYLMRIVRCLDDAAEDEGTPGSCVLIVVANVAIFIG